MSKPKHQTLPFSLERKQIVDYVSIAKAKHTAHVALEFDITGIRNKIRKAGRLRKKRISLTAYMIYCYSRAIAADPTVQAYRKRSKLIVFEDVDVSTMVDRVVGGVHLPVSYILRKANEKSVFQIAQEIIGAKESDSGDLIDNPEMARKKRLFDLIKRIPFLRRIVLKGIFRDPFLKKKFTGTVGFSSMGMFSYGSGGWPIPMTPHSLTVMVGSLREVAGFEREKVVKKEVLDLTASMDHDIIDGAKMAMFCERFRRLLLKSADEFMD